ncbi:hypothetical protein JQX13_15170 [Archangium violaceum]|uniref:hypothetical protein n=1 Tax=Archangium violaceum TaxID=83451 RepID=UPI00193BC343|nr:hypothetical protein [Archangium violaceum]QRK11294.1 hypothetical protein JQX13_15170 [Archangium violaceum]
MMPLRHLLSWSAALLVSFAPVVHAEPSTGLASAPAAICEGSSRGDASLAEQESTTAALCHEALCETEQDCWNACPSARTVACVQFSCQYTYGSGGGGGGGPFCAEQFCSEDWECECNGRPGYCGADSICHF